MKCPSTYANQISGSDGQNGGSLTLTVAREVASASFPEAVIFSLVSGSPMLTEMLANSIVVRKQVIVIRV